MFLYLVQHAESKREEEDPARPLSEKGLQDIKKISSHISALNIKVHKIFHSSKLRAKQTAEVLSETIRPATGISEVDDLAPLDDPNTWAERLKDIPEDIMLVGHLPHLSRLTSLLVSGNEKAAIVSYTMAGIVCLKRDEAGSWSLQWLLTPNVATGEKYSCDSL